MTNYADLMFQGDVRTFQMRDGCYDKNISMYQRRSTTTLGPEEIAFIQAAESFYIGSVNAEGWPYVQHRGGPAGFMKSVGEQRLACLDYVGNRQYISMGNIKHDARISLFIMDYYNRQRLKIQGIASLVTLANADPETLAHFEYKNTPAQRLLTIEVVAFDWNCPKYLPSLVPVTIANEATDSYTEELQNEIAQLKDALAKATTA